MTKYTWKYVISLKLALCKLNFIWTKNWLEFQVVLPLTEFYPLKEKNWDNTIYHVVLPLWSNHMWHHRKSITSIRRNKITKCKYVVLLWPWGEVSLVEQLKANNAVLPCNLEDHPPPLGQPLIIHVVDIDRNFAFRTPIQL